MKESDRTMKTYMVDIALPEVLSEEFLATIPKQRAAVNQMMDEKIILSYSLAMDRSKLWTVIRAESESDVFDVLSEFPLIGWMRFDIYELAFNENSFYKMNFMSLN